MRILVLDTYYPDFVSEVYSSRTDLQARSYAEQHKILIDRCFGTSDAYSSNLRALGYEADEIIVDCAPLQEMWAEENLEGMRKQGRIGLPGRIGGARATLARLRRIALAQIEAYEPSVLYCQNLDFLTRAQLDSLRRRGIFVVGQIASPAPSDRQLRGFDLILSSFPHFVRRFREMGIDSQEFGLAFDSRIIGRLRDEGISSDPGASRDHSVVFVGGVNPRVHAAGTELLERLCRLFPVSVWGYGVDELPPSSAIRRCHHGEAWGLDMYKVLANAKVRLPVARLIFMGACTPCAASLAANIAFDMIESFPTLPVTSRASFSSTIRCRYSVILPTSRRNWGSVNIRIVASSITASTNGNWGSNFW